MLALAAVTLLAQTSPPASPVTQWTALGLLAAVLLAVGRGVQVLLDRSEKRLVAAEAEREKERERDLVMQERLATALIESAQAQTRQTEVMSRLEDGYRHLVAAVERLEARMR